MSDQQLYYEHIRYKRTPEELAEIKGVTASGVRGQLSRARNNREARMKTLTQLTNETPHATDEYEQQLNIIRDSAARLRAVLNELAGDVVRLLWIGDVHVPYQRDDALDLVLQINEDLQPDLATGLNDFYDLAEYGRWGAIDTPNKRLWKNTRQAVAIHGEWNRMLFDFNPKLRNILGLTGNHDIRLFAWLRSNPNGFQEADVLEFMTTLHETGMLWFSNDETHEPVIQLSPGLKIVHGISASIRDSTVANKTIETLAGHDQTGDPGVLYNTASGHVHRDFVVEYKQTGVYHYNFGTLGTLNPDWRKHGSRWQLGCGIIEFDPTSRWVRGYPIRFTPQGNALVAYHNGRKYETGLK